MADAGLPEATPGLRRYLDFVGRRWLVIVTAVVVVTAVALGLNLRDDVRYAASAEVLLTRFDIAGQLSGVSDFTAGQSVERLVETQAQLARVPEVARRAVRDADLPGVSVGELLASSSVTSTGNADLLRFSVVHDDPGVATALVNAYATAFTEYRSSLDVAAVQRVIDDVERRLADLDPDDERDASLILNLEGKLDQLETVQALQTSNALVVRESFGAGKIESSPYEAGAAGAAVGLALGVGLALLLDALDTRLRSDAEIARHLRLPILGRLPSPRRRRAADLVMRERPEDAAAEPFRILRTNLDHALLAADRIVMVTAAPDTAHESPGVTANLALALARASTRTVLIDLDVRQAAVDDLLGVEGRPGLTEVLSGRATLEETLIPVWTNEGRPITGANGRPHLDVLPVGSRPAAIGELLASPGLREVLARLRERADVVLIHGPPLLGTGDALAVSTSVDGLLVVTKAGVVHQDTLAEIRGRLDAVPARTLGVIVTGLGEMPSPPLRRTRRSKRSRRPPSRPRAVNPVPRPELTSALPDPAMSGDQE